MADVFISYSRRDREFVRRLHAALSDGGRDVYVDVEDIPAASRWRQEIAEAIEGADALVCVVSPDSVASPECQKELAHAVIHHKRVIPVVCREMESQAAPAALREINWISCREPDDFEAAVTTLIETLDTDLDWVKAHTRLLTRALEWDRQSESRHKKSLLLRGTDLKNAEEWQAQSGDKKPRPTDLQGQYILASRQGETRRIRQIMGGLIIGIVAVVLAAVVAYSQYREAERRGKIALSRQLAAQANFLLAEHPLMLERSVLLALESLKREITPGGGQALSRGLSLLTRRLARVSQEGNVKALIYNPNGNLLASVSYKKNVVLVRDTASGAEIARLVHPDEIEGAARRVAVAFSPDGSLLATGCKDGYARLWDPATGREIRRLDHGYFNPITKESRNPVNHVAFSPDGRRLATAAKGGRGRIWEVDSGEALYPLVWQEENHLNEYMIGVEYSADGRWLAVAYLNGSVLLREAANTRVATWVQLKLRGTPDSMAFSPDNRWLAAGMRNGRILLMDIADNYRVVWLDHSPGRDISAPVGKAPFMTYGEDVNSIAFSPDSRLLAAGYRDGQVRLWNVADGREVRRLHQVSVITQVVFSPGGGLLAVADYGQMARVYETARWREVGRLIHDEAVLTVAFHPKGKTLATGSADGQVQLWAAPSPPQEVACFAVTPKGDAQEMLFSPDGRWLAAAFIRYSHSSKVLLWDVLGGCDSAQIQVPGDFAAIDFSPDSRYLAISSNYNLSREWVVTRWEPGRKRESSGGKGSSADGGAADSQKLPGLATTVVLGTASLQEVARLKESGNNRVKFSPDSRVLAIWDPNFNTARLWEVASGRELIRLVHDHNIDVDSLAFSPDGRMLATGSRDKTSRLWEVKSGRELHRLEFESPPIQVTFSPDGRWLVSFYDEIRLFEPATGQETGRMKGYGILGFTRDGKMLVLSSHDRAAYVREVDGGREISQFRHVGGANDAAFSPDGRWVASGDSADERGTVHLWEAATGQEWCRLHHDMRIRRLAFSPDGKLLASASLDGSVRLWRWQPEDLIRQACSRLTRNLTRAEWQQYLGDEKPYRPTCPDLPVPQE